MKKILVGLIFLASTSSFAQEFSCDAKCVVQTIDQNNDVVGISIIRSLNKSQKSIEKALSKGRSECKTLEQSLWKNSRDYLEGNNYYTKSELMILGKAEGGADSLTVKYINGANCN